MEQNLPTYRSTRYKKNSKNSLAQNKQFQENLEKAKQSMPKIKTKSKSIKPKINLEEIDKKFEKFENFIKVLDIKENDKALIRNQFQILKDDLKEYQE